jgi:hypothetical protein
MRGYVRNMRGYVLKCEVTISVGRLQTPFAHMFMAVCAGIT